MRMTTRAAALLVALLVAGLVLGASPAEARELEELGSVSFTIGESGDAFGYSLGRHGALGSGRWPGALFADGAAALVTEVYEDNTGHWVVGADSAWLPATALDAFTVTVAYEDGRDTRRFVLGGFVVDQRLGWLKLRPPLPSRDFDSKLGQAVTVTVSRLPIPPAVAPPAVVAEPTAAPDSFLEFLQQTTPGGGVAAQTMIVILVFLGFAFTAKPTPRNIMLAAIVLIITPWVPVVIFGIGSTIAASIIFVNILTGAYAFKSFAARTEA